MAVNITFTGDIYDSAGSQFSGAEVSYQLYFLKLNSGSSSSTWSNIRTSILGQYNLNLADSDLLTTSGNASAGDKVIIAFWLGGARMGTNCSVLDEWGAVEIVLTSADTYVNHTQVKTNIAPTLDWSFPVATGTVGTSYVTTNSSDDVHTWDWSGTTMGHYSIWNGEPIFFIDYVRLTHYDWDDGNQDNDLPLASIGTHTWTASGDYTVEIVVEDHCGATTTGTHNVRMLYPEPSPGIICNEAVGNTINDPNTVVTFNYDGDNPYSRVYNIDWTIQDDTNTTASGGTSTTINHTNGTGTSWYGQAANPGAFTDPGTHNVAVVVYWNDGFNNQTTLYNENFTQELFSGPSIDFTQIPSPVTVFSGVSFVNNTTDTDSRVGTGVSGIEYNWEWNDDGSITTVNDAPYSFILSGTLGSDNSQVELCGVWNDGWTDHETCVTKDVVVETTISVVQEDCYYNLDIFGTSDDGSVSGYYWDIYRSTTSGSSGPWDLVWNSQPAGLDQKEYTVAFTESNFFKIIGYVEGNGTTSDDEIISVPVVCTGSGIAAGCTLVLWNGTGLLDTSGDWEHAGHGFEATYADGGAGTNGLDAYSFNNNKQISFTSPTTVNVDDYDLLSIWLNVKKWAGNKDVSVYFDVGNAINLSNYTETNNHNVWQQALIPFSDFGLSAPITVSELTLASNGNIDFYLDDVEFIVGSVVDRTVSVNPPEMEAKQFVPITEAINVTPTVEPEPTP